MQRLQWAGVVPPARALWVLGVMSLLWPMFLVAMVALRGAAAGEAVSGALAAAWYFQLDRAGTVVALPPALAPAYLAWRAFSHDRAETTAMDLGTVADRLAQAVREQWDEEAAARRMNDPCPLPVAWCAADADPVEPWSLLTRA
ncbi:hypothetical protein [Streptomyces atacamensis]|uniref:hypothetical protein n=1 Tax=Streptomyces atacamensis TaxID=531966 RepID=UPI00399CC148